MKLFGLLILVALVSFGVTFFLLNNRVSGVPSKHFAGNEFVQEKLPDIAPPYTIDIILKSKNATAPIKYSENSPPMPLLSGPLSIYQIGDKLRFHNGKKNIANVKPQPQWNRVTFVLDKAQQGTLFFNGKSVWAGLVNKKLKTISIGKGHKKRYWSGDIRRLIIYSGMLYTSDFDANENALPQDVSILYKLPLAN